MSRVFVLDPEKHPLMPCSPRRARGLLTRGKAAVFRRYPFTLILKPRVAIGAQLPLRFESAPAPAIEGGSHLRLKIDPGSRTTGLSIVNDGTGEVVFAAELTHRGRQIKAALDDRRARRRNRRQRKTRYRLHRARRFSRRGRPEGWLAPSLQSRIENVLTWVNRLRRLCPISTLSQELVRFDTQMMEHPDIAGVEYQRGELYGYEVREYLLEKWHRRCAYCGKTDVHLEIEHIIPKSRDGSDRVSNLTLACHRCNQRKGNRTAAEFGHPDLEDLAKKPLPLKDAAAVNSTRRALYRRLQSSGLPVEVGTGGRTKWNRTQRQLPKTHWLDAACVGESTPRVLDVAGVRPLLIKATGHGHRRMVTTDAFGFPKTHRARRKRYFGFQTGDMVRAIIPPGLKYAGTWVSRVVVRAKGSFEIMADKKKVGVHHQYCARLWSSDGYTYNA